MIKKLDSKNLAIAKKIHLVFQVSYTVEANLLSAVDFPPLKRTIADFLKSKSDFYGFFQNNQLIAAVEVRPDRNHTHIQSLVVDPYYFRRGIGNKLMTFVFKTYNTSTFTVETGVFNLPAIALYKKLGFIEIKQWNTDHGIRKVRFEKQL